MGNTTSHLLSVATDSVAEDFTLPLSLLDQSRCKPCVHFVSARISDLPDEMLLKIFSHFSIPELCSRVIPVCRKWYDVGHDVTLWRSLKFGSGWAATRNVSPDTIRNLLKKSPLLKTFEYHSNNYVSHVLKALARNCPKLQTLELQSRSLTYRTVEALVLSCTNIRQISFFGIEDTDHTKYLPLSNLKHLRALEFSHCDWANDDLILAMSKNCDQLQYVNLQILYFLTDKSLSVLLQKCKKTLRTLRLCLWSISDKSFKQVAECTNIQHLTIAPACNVRDSSFHQFVNLKKLELLTLHRLWNVSKETCQAVFGHPNMKNLKEVELILCESVDDSVIKSLAVAAPNLSVLSLEHCSSVSDDGLISILAMSKNLVYLNLEKMSSLRGRFLVDIEAMLPHLLVLRLSHCSRVDPYVLDGLLSRRKTHTKLRVFTERSHAYKEMEASLLNYPATHQARFQVKVEHLNFKERPSFDISSCIFRRSVW